MSLDPRGKSSGGLIMNQRITIGRDAFAKTGKTLVTEPKAYAEFDT
jgi:hypothetical protein